jgi:hypothetical protein
MPDQEFYIAEKVKNWIREKYPFLAIQVYYEETQDNYVIAINKDEIYYSPEFLSLVSEIKSEYLWKKGIYNYLFVCEDEHSYGALLSENWSHLTNKTSYYKEWVIEQSEDKVVSFKSDFQIMSGLEMAA